MTRQVLAISFLCVVILCGTVKAAPDGLIKVAAPTDGLLAGIEQRSNKAELDQQTIQLGVTADGSVITYDPEESSTVKDNGTTGRISIDSSGTGVGVSIDSHGRVHTLLKPVRSLRKPATPIPDTNATRRTSRRERKKKAVKKGNDTDTESLLKGKSKGNEALYWVSTGGGGFLERKASDTSDSGTNSSSSILTDDRAYVVNKDGDIVLPNGIIKKKVWEGNARKSKKKSGSSLSDSDATPAVVPKSHQVREKKRQDPEEAPSTLSSAWSFLTGGRSA